MIAEKLRKAVLQAAMQGKLTKQLSEDGNAIDLLKQIKTKDVVRNDIPFEIPENWIWTKLGVIGKSNIGLTYKPENIKTSGTLVLRSSNIQNGILTYDDNVFVDLDIPENKFAQVNDILICARNGSKRLVGKAAIIDKQGMSFGAFMSIYRTAFYNYVYYYLQSPYFRQDFDGVSTTTINQITQSNLLNRLIPLPPFEEQKRIVEKLEILLAEIDKLEQDEKALKELEDKFPERLKSAIIESAMKGKITNQDLNDNSVVEILTKIEINKGIKFRVINEDEKPYSIPMNWVWISHNDILEISGGSQPPKSTFSELPKENYIRLYQIRDYGSNPQPVYIPIETATKQTKKGDILLARYGASLGKVFYAEEGAYNVAMAKVIPLFKEDILYNDFLFYYYKSSQYQSLVLKNTRSAQAGFNKNDLNKLLIALPPIEEQKRIVDKLDKIFKLNFIGKQCKV